MDIVGHRQGESRSHERGTGTSGTGEATTKNRARRKLQAGNAIIGAAVGVADADVSEWLAHMGSHRPMPDMEHVSLSYPARQRMMQSIGATRCTAVEGFLTDRRALHAPPQRNLTATQEDQAR